MALSIYKYSCPHEFLRDSWLAKKRINSAFSLRAWSKTLGFKNNSPLSLMLKGSRPIPKKYLPQFVNSLDLTSKEAFYLETLVDFSKEKNSEAKEFYLARLKSIEPTAAIDMKEVQSFKYFGDPIHMVILEMVDLKDFIADSKWIQKRLVFKADLAKIEKALALLMEMGFIEKLENGKFKKNQPHITTKNDVLDEGVRAYHKNVSDLAKIAIDNQDVLFREFSGYSLNIKKKNLKKAKTLIRDFIKQFIVEVEATPGQGDATYQLGVQFFSHTNNESGELK